MVPMTLSYANTSCSNYLDSSWQADFYLEADSSDITIPSAQIAQYSKRIQNKIETSIYTGWANITTGDDGWTHCTPTTLKYVWDSSGGRTVRFPLKPSERLREMIQARQAPLIIGTRTPLARKVNEREQRARDTLRRLVGENQYRRFLAHGFITARGKSGKVYQIKPGHGITTVYSPTGQPLEKLCVVLRGNFPPTDETITRYLMILNDEDHFRSLAIVSKPYMASSKPAVPDQRPLPEIFEMLKRQAA